MRLLNPICDEEVSIASPNEAKVKIVNDLMSNQVGFRVNSTKLNVLQSEGTISIPLERTGAVGTVSWIRWKIDGPPHFEGLNQDGMATFQANECDGVIMLNLPQKPISEVNFLKKLTFRIPAAHLRPFDNYRRFFRRFYC